MAKSYNNIGLVYETQGKYEEALEYYQKSLDIRIRVFGSDHPDVAASFIHIGAVYAGKGDNKNALVQYQKGLEIQTRVFGSEHPDVSNSFYNLACVYATRDSMLCRDMLLKAEQTGFLHLLKEYMKTDSALDAVRELEWCKELVRRI